MTDEEMLKQAVLAVARKYTIPDGEWITYTLYAKRTGNTVTLLSPTLEIGPIVKPFLGY